MTVAFVNVAVASMDDERVLERQTVVVEGDRIVAIGDSAVVSPPPGALRVEGRGRYLLPGLADMDFHFDEEGFAALCLAYGVTTVRNMWGRARHLQWRDEIRAGGMLAPRFVTCGALIDGRPAAFPGAAEVMTARDADAVVEAQAGDGFDFVNVYHGLSQEVHAAVVWAARRRAMPVTGHVPYAVGLYSVIAAGQRCVERLTAHVRAAQSERSPYGADPRDRHPLWDATDYIDWSRVEDLTAALREAEVWSCVTLVVAESIRPADERESVLRRPAMAYLPPAMRERWRAGGRAGGMTTADLAAYRRGKAARLRLVRELHRGGARLLIGTDAAVPLVIPGFALHEELALFVEAGLTPYEALRIATRDAAEFLGWLADAGPVATGKRADLILVDGDPLVDIGHVARPAGVMAGGRWLSREALDGMLADLAAANADAAT